MLTRVAVIEDNPTFLHRFVDYIAAAPEFCFCGSAESAHAGLALIEQNPADIYLVDLGLPDRSGTEVIRQARATHPDCQVMVVSVFADEAHIMESIEAGALGYLLKDSSFEEFIDCLRSLRDGGARMSPSIARTILQRLCLAKKRQTSAAERAPSTPIRGPGSQFAEQLTARELEILAVLARGLSFHEIAAIMFISAHTVAQHVKNIYRKLAVHSRCAAVYEAGKRGLLN